MKKKVCSIILGCVMVLGLSGCGNYQLIDTMYDYNKAIIQLQTDEVIECKVAKWTDYEGEQLQIWDSDGNIYLVNSYNCTLIKEKYFD